MNEISHLKFRGDWLESIPKDWKQSKIKHRFSIKKIISGELGYDVISITQRGAKIKDIESGEGQLSMDYSKYQIVNSGDFLMNHMDLLTGYIDIANFDGVTSPDYRVFQLNDPNCDPQYYLYVFQHCYKSKIFYAYGRGSSHLGRWRFPTVEFEDFYVPIPPLEEQKLISQCLNKKTTQIDSLVEKIQKKIELLKEQRTSLINQCVTKGIDSNVEMKDSGVKWIGEIPKHWELRRLATLGFFSKGKNVTKNDLTEYGEPVILYSHLYTTYSRLTDSAKYFVSKEKSLETTKISKGTFLLTSSGESVEEIGKTLLYNGKNEISVGGDIVIFSLKSDRDISPDFFSYSLNSDNCQRQKSSMSRGQIIVHVYEKQLREVWIAIPPASEQMQITKLLDQNEKNSSNLINCLKRKIEILREYRQSLISSVVTGKIRVTEDMI
jgi:type I restriction enzyme, S subunit